MKEFCTQRIKGDQLKISPCRSPCAHCLSWTRLNLTTNVLASEELESKIKYFFLLKIRAGHNVQLVSVYNGNYNGGKLGKHKN